MTESEFLDLSDGVFAKIETALDNSDLDIDTLLSGNVLEIEFADRSKIIVNRHSANQELWIAARSGGYHYRLQDGVWQSTREAGEFFADLAHAIADHAKEDFAF